MTPRFVNETVAEVVDEGHHGKEAGQRGDSDETLEPADSCADFMSELVMCTDTASVMRHVLSFSRRRLSSSPALPQIPGAYLDSALVWSALSMLGSRTLSADYRRGLREHLRTQQKVLRHTTEETEENSKEKK